MATWSESELERRRQVESGFTVVANRTVDHALIQWARDNGLYAYIGRPSRWGNPFVIGKHGDRTTCIEKYRAKLIANAERVQEVESLRGKVLGCFCHPQPCHGDVILELLSEA
jgi:hypothetical protein